jgi:hypothetical protein
MKLYDPRFRNPGIQALRLASLVGNVVTDTVRYPRQIPQRTREVANLLMEQHFTLHSPLPPLDDAVLNSIYADPVVLPPPSRLRSGNQSIAGLLFLASLFRALEGRELFEIGTYNGLTAWTLARNRPEATVNTLDLPATLETELSLDPRAGDTANRKHWNTLAYHALPHTGTVTQHWGDSATFDFSPWFGKCDLVYVDGAHSKAYVESDTSNAVRMVSDRGAIVWDDYWWRLRGVQEILDHRTDLNIARVPQTRLAVYLTPGARKLLDRKRSGGS